MVCKGKSIPHGHNGAYYITGESVSKKHPERITRICDGNLPPGLDAPGIWNAIKMSTLNHPRMKNNAIRIEISPPKEYTRGFSHDDWRRLVGEILREFDRQEFKDRSGKTVSPKTNLCGSIYTAWLHEESRGEIPHVHILASRVDMQGRVNNDHQIHLRAIRAAEAVARKRGWRTAAEYRPDNIREVTATCMEALREMQSWSLGDYFERLERKGLKPSFRPDSDGRIHGYSLRKGNSSYKASELGKGRDLTIKNLEKTWSRLHPASARYMRRKDGWQPVDIAAADGPHRRFIPPKILQEIKQRVRGYPPDDSARYMSLALYYFAVAGLLSGLRSSSPSSGENREYELSEGYSFDNLDSEIMRAKACAQAAINEYMSRRQARLGW